MDNNLKQTCTEAQNGSEDAMLCLVRKFNPIIAKYAFLLRYEDSKADLVLFVIDLIGKMKADKFQAEGQLVSYVVKSIQHEYIRLSRLKDKKAENEFLTDDLFEQPAPIDPMEASDLKILMLTLLRQLTVKERIILYKHFVEDKPISQIATEEGTSRQAVNQIKNVACKKLKARIDQEGLQS